MWTSLGLAWSREGIEAAHGALGAALDSLPTSDFSRVYSTRQVVRSATLSFCASLSLGVSQPNPSPLLVNLAARVVDFSARRGVVHRLSQPIPA
ncbi:hypothetical protein KKF91_11505 [Myxococcota bacterium]|nr:hypothetical protein [Myxococcota bacterium]